jgi:hypothetical protein
MRAKGEMVLGGTSGDMYDVFMKWIVLYFILFYFFRILLM